MKLNVIVSAAILLAITTLSDAHPFEAVGRRSPSGNVYVPRSLNTNILDKAPTVASNELEEEFAHAHLAHRDVDHLGNNHSSTMLHKRAHGSRRSKRCSSKSGSGSGDSASKIKSGSSGSSSDSSSGSSSGSDSSSGSSSGSSSSSKSAKSSKSSNASSDDSSNDDSGSDSSSSSSSSSSGSSSGKGLIGMAKFSGSQCAPDASSQYPNGNINFLNCGLQKSGSGNWHPPAVKLSQVKVLDSSSAASSSVFAPCKKYKSAFDSASQQTGVPATFLMAFAMQESTCNQGSTGPNGEVGLMQLTEGTAKSLGISNPHDATQNALGGAKYFKNLLDQSQNNVLLAVGQYNGWTNGMSYHDATSRNGGSPCAQNNLDYLNQFFNGWIQGKSGDSIPKVFNNMKTCKD